MKNNKLFYEVIGHGKPVVIIHGLGGNGMFMKQCMEPIFQKLSSYQRIYIDLPGMGKSLFDKSYASSDMILKVLIHFIQKNIKENFLLIGQSYGGYLVRGILAYFQERVDGMMLLCPVIYAKHEERTVPELKPRFLDFEFLSQLDALARERFLEYAVIGNKEVYHRFKQSTSTCFEEADQDFLKELDNHYAFTFDVDQIIHKHRFNKPTLFICGRQDNCVGYKDMYHIIEDYPRSTISIIDTAGHNLHLEQPEIFQSLVFNWLSTLAIY